MTHRMLLGDFVRRALAYSQRTQVTPVSMVESYISMGPLLLKRAATRRCGLTATRYVGSCQDAEVLVFPRAT